MACPHRITCNANDIRNLLVLIESGGEVRGAMQAGLLLQVLVNRPGFCGGRFV